MKTQSFKFENGISLRVADEVVNQETWFVAKDVCDILGITNITQATNRLDDDEKLMYTLHISGQDRETWVINESGLYSLVLTSNKPDAKKFKRWITHEVLPSIRKAGRYSSDDMHQREQTIQQLINSIEALEHDVKEQSTLLNTKKATIKAKQSELRVLLKSDIYQLKINM